MSRIALLTREGLSPAQTEVYNSINAGARGGVRGPFRVLLHSPDLARRVEQLGVYVRFQCKVPERLRELAIVTVAAHWRAAYEWYAHAPLAQKQGITETALAAIAQGETPDFSEAGDRITHAYVAHLLKAGRVSDAVYGEAKALLGEDGIVDLTGLVGYYTLLALQLNAFQVPVPDDAETPWPVAE
ncbi:carboxymuconolactone decarboxylase family protein [Aquabacter spiritensis]|uniref:4-carboxymuconolactone decarboxylase n=1 Tax=Aquabacter spiritensis TaxID=933073 RepID=A0A4R3M4X3_9HYPH|nr:carboxymuconolactone decarboxylase family protein [Aquabacter spiritensis]TCT08320.1 4-carboxymuconolactone decarboxylase [Aquabacter spiritensis]